MLVLNRRNVRVGFWLLWLTCFGVAEAFCQPVAVDEADRQRELRELTRMRNHARLFSEAGRTKEAVELAERVLRAEIRLLGPTASEVLQTLTWLSWRYMVLEDYAAARRAATERLAILKQTKGQSHWEVATAAQHLNYVERAQEADPQLLREILVLGRDIEALQNEDKHAEALEKSLQLKEVSRILLGEDHAEYADVLSDIHEIYGRDLKNYPKATEYAERALEIRRKVLGSDHPDTALALVAVSGCYKLQERYDEAIELLEECIRIRLKAFGDEDEWH